MSIKTRLPSEGTSPTSQVKTWREGPIDFEISPSGSASNGPFGAPASTVWSVTRALRKPLEDGSTRGVGKLEQSLVQVCHSP